MTVLTQTGQTGSIPSLQSIVIRKLEPLILASVKDLPKDIFKHINRNLSSWQTEQVECNRLLQNIPLNPDHPQHVQFMQAAFFIPNLYPQASSQDALSMVTLAVAKSSKEQEYVDRFCDQVFQSFTEQEIEKTVTSWARFHTEINEETIALSLYVKKFLMDNGSNLANCPSEKKLILELLSDCELILDMQNQPFNLAPAIRFVFERVFRSEKHITIKTMLLSSYTELNEFLQGPALKGIENLDLAYHSEKELLEALPLIPKKCPNLKVLSFKASELTPALLKKLEALSKSSIQTLQITLNKLPKERVDLPFANLQIQQKTA